MDKRIVNDLKNLKNDIKPRPEWVSSSRELLLNQIRASHKPVEKVGFLDTFNIFIGVVRNRAFEPAVVMLLLLATFIGSSLTINAAFYSLPGDGLYNVKIALEKTHVALTPDDQKKVELKLEFAQKRFNEFDKIVAQSGITPEEKKKKLETVVKEFKSNVSSVNDHLNKIKTSADGDVDTSVKMAVAISSQSEELAKEIDKKTSSFNEEDKVELSGIVAEAVASIEEVSLSAKQIVDEVESSNEEEVVETDTNTEETTDENQVTAETDPSNTQASEGDTSDLETDTSEKTLE